MKILLITPKARENDITPPAWNRVPQLSLSVLAGLTPGNHDVVTAEEADGPIPDKEHYDVVGISTMTAMAPRAYELARKFRKRGSKVVLGGIHPSVMPREAREYADAVVVGEAEGLWPHILDDIENGTLKKVYRNWQPDISDSPTPRYKRRRSFWGIPPYLTPVMFSRGCPNDCEFCTVHKIYGRKPRFLPVESVVRDIKEAGSKRLIFLDDNIGGIRSYAMDLFKAVEPLKVNWIGQASARMMLDDELFEAAVRSGCACLFVGVESIEPAALGKFSKSLPTISLYEEAIKRCRETGILFHGSFIFGLDDQSPDVFEHTLDFLIRNRVPSVSPNILTPYPGTDLFDRFIREDRLLHSNWSYFDHVTVSFRPKNMQPEELAEKYFDFRDKFYSLSSIWQHTRAQVKSRRFLTLVLNLGFHRMTGVHRARSRDYFKWLNDDAERFSVALLKNPARFMQSAYAGSGGD